MKQKIAATEHVSAEWSYQSQKKYSDPFNDLELDVVISNGDGGRWTVPAYWAGGQEWRVRFAAPDPGVYRFHSVCSDSGNEELHGQEGELTVSPYQGENPLLRHGHIQVSENRRHFRHADGTPFFWLGDTWWYGLCSRLRWPKDFKYLVANRKELGFSLFQIFVSFPPDSRDFDPRGSNQAGLAWEQGYSRINPKYFDAVDLRIQHLVESGIVPCIYGCQGYYYVWMGEQVLKKHWRYLIGRYGAYPVLWCLAGETTSPYYLLDGTEEWDRNKVIQKKGWTEIARYVRSEDPYRHPVTSHPYPFIDGRDDVEEEGVLDFNLLQCGHGGYENLPKMADFVVKAYKRTPVMPVVNGESNYEGMFGRNWEDIQRFHFWTSMLSGVAGYTYGADGIMQMNDKEQLFGPSPFGIAWGNTTWQDASRFAGCRQIAKGKQLLERYPWWEFEPHQEWVKRYPAHNEFTRPYCAGIPNRVRILYYPEPTMRHSPPITVQRLEAGSRYKAFYFDPRSGEEYPLEKVDPEQNGGWTASYPPIAQDWVLVLENLSRRRSSDAPEKEDNIV